MLDGHLFGNDQQTDPTLPDQQQQQQQASTTNYRLLIYVSCLISATLLALQLAAAAYNKAHARRLLGAIPAHPPPPLLVTNLRIANSTPSALGSHNGAGQTINQTTTHTINCSDQTSPTYSSSDYSVALQASKIKLEQQQQQQQQRQLTNPSGLFPSRLSTCSVSQLLKQLTFPIHLIAQLFVLELLIVLLVESQNYLERRTARHAHLLLNSTTTASPSWNWQTSQFMQPLDFIVAVPPSDQLTPIGLITWLLVITLYYLIAAITCWLAGQLIRLNVTLVRQHWHLKRLIRGSCSPSSVGSSTEASDKSMHYGATNSTAISSSVNPVSASICSQQQQQQLDSRLPVGMIHNFYGPNSCYGQYNTSNNQQQQHQLHHLNNLHSSTSPTSSLSSTGNQSMSDPNTALSRLEVDSTRLYSETPRFALSTSLGQKTVNKDTKNPFRNGGQCLINNLPLDKLYLFVIHILPVLLVIVIALLSVNKVESLNASYFTTNFSFQVAYWPLLVELSSTPLSALLYYEPAICLTLVSFALFMLRSAYNWTTKTTKTAQNGGTVSGYAVGKQQQAAMAVVNPYGSSTMNLNNNSRHFQQQQHVSTANNFLGSNNEQQQQQQQQQQLVLNKQSEMGPQNGLEYGSAKWLQMADFSHTNEDLKKAKFLCTMLLAILALHSICWISFFAHIHQALNSPPLLVSSWPQAQQQREQSRWLVFSLSHLTYAFALSNLALTLLVSWWQRKTIRRAAQLSGIARFICAPKSSGSRSRRQASRFYRAHQTSTGAAKISNGGQVKVSPSSQSLFIVSQQQQQPQPQHPSYHYGPSYSSNSHQVSQHLYQQLSNQQHIYDSTSAINLAGSEQHHRFNMLLQHQQQQRHLHQMHQQDAFTLNRSQQQRQFAQQQQLEQRQLMTLKPTSLIQPSHSDNGQLLILDANQALKQQHQQQGFNACQGNKTASYLDRSGEAEGPLVAFTSSSASSGAASSSSTSSANNNNSTQVPVTFGPNSAASAQRHRQFQASQQQEHQMLNYQLSSEHQLFSGHQQLQDQSLATITASPTINCISSASSNGDADTGEHQAAATRHSVAAIRTSAADANQHQYCSINNPVGGKNYTDALKAALLEQQLQQQNESSLLSQHQPHFRPRLEATNNNNNNNLQVSIGQTISGAKHNHNNSNNNHYQQQQLALLRHQADTSNIYDVALNH